MGEAWKGGDVGRSIGGGQKVRLLKEAMDTLGEQQDLVVLSVDRYDALKFISYLLFNYVKHILFIYTWVRTLEPELVFVKRCSVTVPNTT